MGKCKHGWKRKRTYVEKREGKTEKRREKKKLKSRRKEKQGTRQQKTEKLTSKPEGGKLKRETEI